MYFVNDIVYGLGAGVWICDINIVYCMVKNIKVGRVWVNCYYVYFVYVVFGGYKKFGIGWEIYKLILSYY